MHWRDSIIPGGWLRPGTVVLLLIGFLVSIGPPAQPIEWWYYDWLQSLQVQQASQRIVLVDTDRPEQNNNIGWSSPDFPALLRAAKAAGAALIVPTQAPPAGAALPDAEQLMMLDKMEQRRRSSGPLADGEESFAASFAAQLAEIREQSERQAELINAIKEAGNVVVAVHAVEQRQRVTAGGACRAHALQQPVTANGPTRPARRRVLAMDFPADSLCQASLALGHLEYWPEADGTVRRTDLYLDVSGWTFPAFVLAAAGKAGKHSQLAGPTEPVQAIPAIGEPEQDSIFNRHYPDRDTSPAFDVVRAEDLLTGTLRSGYLAGRIAVIGSLRGTDGVTFATPVSERTPAMLLVATGISNLLQEDYLVRPRWMPWVESLLLVLIWGALLAAATRIGAASVAICALTIAMTLLGVEAYLVISSPGMWFETAGLAFFTAIAPVSLPLLRPRGSAVTTTPVAPSAQVPKAPNLNEELDLAFSVLRQQPAGPMVKKRLYDIALEHARRRDFARAERVLRHLAGLDPGYRSVGEKLKKLAGLRSADELRGKQVATTTTATGSPASERRLGRYVLEQVIGRGAMATVYLGRDPAINRKVAVKTIALAQEFGDSDLANARAQFIREAESAGRLNHPGIITIYDVGEDGQTAYLAMEYFPGTPLSQYAQEDRLLPPAQVFDLMARAAEALHYAHTRHVVHRDIKPANLLYDERTDALKITDFGIARLTDTSRTKTGIILGTPSYMSPEQLAGHGVNGQSDLFSLGVTTYQLLTGMPPFRADSIPRLMQKIAHEPHEPVTRLRDELPPAVDRLLDRALAKNPADRFSSGREMALALRDCCSSLLVVPAVRTA